MTSQFTGLFSIRWTIFSPLANSFLQRLHFAIYHSGHYNVLTCSWSRHVKSGIQIIVASKRKMAPLATVYTNRYGKEMLSPIDWYTSTCMQICTQTKPQQIDTPLAGILWNGLIVQNRQQITMSWKEPGPQNSSVRIQMPIVYSLHMDNR